MCQERVSTGYYVSLSEQRLAVCCGRDEEAGGRWECNWMMIVVDSNRL